MKFRFGWKWREWTGTRNYPGRREVEDCLRLLDTGRDAGEKAEAYYADKLRQTLLVLGGGLAVCLLLLVTGGRDQVLTDGYLLPRKERSYSRELQLHTEEGEQESVTVEIEPRKLTAEESRALLEKALAEMEGRILGENASLEEVRSDLNLIQEIEGTPITVEWELDHYGALNLDGSLRTEKLTEEGSLTELTARLLCEGEEAVYRTVVRAFPPRLSEQEQWEQSLQEALELAQEESSEEAVKKLPETIDGHAVSWEERVFSQAGAAFLLTLVAAGTVFILRDRDLKRQVLERDRQLQRDYARVVSRLVLLMGAGASARNAWELTVKDYQEKKAAGRTELRYVYEEMTLAGHEMQSGVAELRAYENFGMRCRLPCYLKLTALLEQNLRQGGRGLGQLLNAEIAEAFEQRKSCALSRGEEAATRLLFPMVMMLAVVMLLIMVPAGMAMQM